MRPKRRISWMIVGLALLYIAVIVLVMIAFCGCGTHAELTYNPVTGVWDIYYHNNRPLGPENVTLTTPNGVSLVIGEQATQNAVIGKLTDTVTILSGVGK